MPLDLTFQLQQLGALGEEHSGDDGSCWITKTHFPMESFEIKFHANKMIVIARNPIDVVPSMMQLVNMLSHSLKQKESFKDDLPEFWNAAVPLAVGNMKKNQKLLLKITETIPTYFIRFEDIRTDAVPVMLECMKFILDVDSIEGTIVEKRVLEKCSKGNAPKSTYKMKSTSTSLSRNIGEYTDEQIDHMKVELREFLHFFGYTNHPEVEHNTAFFEYNDQTEKDLSEWKSF